METVEKPNSDDLIAQQFKLVRFAFSQVLILSVLILAFSVFLHLVLGDLLMVELFTSNFVLFSQVFPLVSLIVAFVALALNSFLEKMHIMAQIEEMNLLADKEQRAVIQFDNKPLRLLEGYSGETHGLWAALYEAKAIESELPEDDIRSINKRINDVYALLNEYLLMNSAGRKAVEGSISKVMGVFVQKLGDDLKNADELRISRIERKVERILS